MTNAVVKTKMLYFSIGYGRNSFCRPYCRCIFQMPVLIQKTVFIDKYVVICRYFMLRTWFDSRYQRRKKTEWQFQYFSVITKYFLSGLLCFAFFYSESSRDFYSLGNSTPVSA